MMASPIPALPTRLESSTALPLPMSSFDIDLDAARERIEALDAVLRADRQRLGVEGGLAGHHAEALAQQVERQAVADFGAAGDLGQHRGLVHVLGVEQRQFGRVAAETADGRAGAGRG